MGITNGAPGAKGPDVDAVQRPRRMDPAAGPIRHQRGGEPGARQVGQRHFNPTVSRIQSYNYQDRYVRHTNYDIRIGVCAADRQRLPRIASRKCVDRTNCCEAIAECSPAA
ncbi:hypothetical protein [Micromonospora pisi]|uniref:hypothetical protein n=1 Tax=Micromonospora pisi TaxID=589240 RepID=UPI0011C3488E|nr:hypothetical protein [Micromonospora pisi]